MTDFPWEDNLLERKTEGDLKDLLATMVAFANSVRPSRTAVILIGEKNDGTVQGLTNPDNIQKKVREEADKIYPPILWRSKVYEKNGRFGVRVEIEHDGETPHFGGIAWIRRGSENIKATDQIFQWLIDFRSSKVRQLALWLNEPMTVQGELVGDTMAGHPRWAYGELATLKSVNGFYATFERANGTSHSEPLEKIIISWNGGANRPMLIIKT